ncbi:MAG: helix-turn-helix domain-containing protein [Desulfobulbaceae bacterium]|nr:helix-turn-helix domain-containing protein [Desulfobulbaceae bacterium]HIJ78015.1 helix-turn-helix domain-containing protein [Deltaproteobacteria bacterium]
MTSDRPLSSGIQMIKIDGDKIRRLREHNGLTQLYVATVVGVTTDTISRWENKRYPSIKKENAIKLCEALAVPLESIIDLDDHETAPSQTTEQDIAAKPPNQDQRITPTRLPLKNIGLAVAILVFAGIAVWTMTKYQATTTPINIADQLIVSRTMPSHVPPGAPFPVMVEITSNYPEPFPFILKENLPPNAKAIQGKPLFTRQNNNPSDLKWISKLTGDYAVFIYLVQPSEHMKIGEMLEINGLITCKKENKMTTPIGGDNSITIDSHHWADSNRDGKIDDEEILSVYDTYGAIEGLKVDKEKIEEIWSGKGYQWNRQTRQYEIEF